MSTYEIPVIEADANGQPATLEIWASAEESEHVQITVTYSAGIVGIGVDPDIAMELADALDQRVPFDAPAHDDYDDGPAELQISWDDDGADLLLVFQDGSVRTVIDYDDQPEQIAYALRECTDEIA